MCDQLRIATALCALKFKPAEQSIHSYVLDLRAKFPSPLPGPPTGEGSWRTYALNLEQQVATLQTKYEAEQIKTRSEAPKRRTRKKNGGGVKTTLEDVIPASGTMSGGLWDFYDLTNSLSSKTSMEERQLVESATIRVLESVGSVLGKLLDPQEEIKTAAQVDVLENLTIIVHQVLTTCFGILGKKVEAVVDKVVMLILRPLVKSFSSLSVKMAETVLAKRKSSDLRPGGLCLFRNMYEVTWRSAFGLKESLGLEMIRELDSLYPGPGDRIARLARKDALWYLCCGLQIVRSESAQVVTGLSALVARREVLDSAEQSVLMGVVEAYLSITRGMLR